MSTIFDKHSSKEISDALETFKGAEKHNHWQDCKSAKIFKTTHKFLKLKAVEITLEDSSSVIETISSLVDLAVRKYFHLDIDCNQLELTKEMKEQFLKDYE